jgi:hypothetical protein
MEERNVAGATERPIPGEEPATTGGPPHLADPRALTILTTEHWSLLSARSLVYNEAFARSGMFLTFLTGSLVALGFVAQGSGFGAEFLMVAAAVLAFDLFLGFATLGRIINASDEEFRTLQGMNRIRHAYLEIAPSLEPYFVTSSHDDLLGVLSIYGATPAQPNVARNLFHGLTTTAGMIATITCIVGAALAASLLLLVGASGIVATVGALVAFVVLFALESVVMVRFFTTAGDHLEVRFPSPPPVDDARGTGGP